MACPGIPLILPKPALPAPIFVSNALSAEDKRTSGPVGFKGSEGSTVVIHILDDFGVT